MGFKFLTLLYCVLPCLLCMLDLSKAESKKRILELNSFITSDKYDTTWIDWQTLRMTKAGRSQIVVSGDITLVRNLGNEQRLDLRILRKTGVSNGYTAPIYVVNKAICDYVSSDTIVYPAMLKCSNFSQPDVCPLSKGDYKFNNCIVDGDSLPKSIPNGEYKVVAAFFDGQKDVAGIEAEIALTDE